MASSSSPEYKYDVFLSFRGDIRLTYIGHLYRALSQRGVVTFMDDKSLPRGKSISPEIEKSIRSSRFAIVVFSQNYAKSGWCMEELVEIIRRMEDGLITVLPIFHGVDPTHVCDHTGDFALNLETLQEDEKHQLPIWGNVLTKAANVVGWDARNRDEATVIEEVVMHVLTQLSRITSNVVSGLVGMGVRMNKMKSLLEVGLNDVRMVGICGMGGVGKTTIAEQIFRSVSSNFDGCCFLERVQEAMKNSDGRSNLQKQLLSAVLGLKPWDNVKPIDLAMRSKCVLIVLDDVDDIRHLETLAGKHDWFGPGSRIIITSRNKQMLEAHGVDKVYEVELLTDLESLKLFKHYAFRDSSETDELAALSQQAINYANGLPLAVKVLGSSLTKKSFREWRDELDKLEVYPPEEVQSALQVSFLGLNRAQKKIFLDIACFFNGHHVNQVIDFWESCRLFPVSGLSSLEGKCLITIIDNKILMHDLLQEMGRNIVREESEDPGERSRLWDHNDVCSILLENKGTDKIEGIVLDLSITNEANFMVEAFSKMTKLRLLKIHYVHFSTVYEYPFNKDFYLRINSSERVEMFPDFPNVLMDKFAPPVFPSVHHSGDMITFPNELRCLNWLGYPLEYLPTNFYPRNLVELNMSYSCIMKFWTERKQFDRLKIINLCNSKELIATPDFTGIPNLEVLVLKGCTSLKEVHPSVGLLKNLLLLNLENCRSIQKFPNVIDMKSLEVFFLSGCVQFELFPNIEGNTQHMAALHLDGTAVTELPDSIGLLSGLQVLSAKNCKYLTRISISITNLKALRILDVSGCSNLKELPENMGQLEDLEELRLDETGVTKPPTSITFLRKLQVLSFHGCPFNGSSSHDKFSPVHLLSTPLNLDKWIFLNLSSLTYLDLSYCNLRSSSIPVTFSGLSSLIRLNLSGNLFEDLPDSVCCLPNLEVLHLAHCKFLYTLSALPSSIYYIDASNCCRLLMVEYPAGVNLSCMRSFNFMNCSFLRHNVELVASHIEKISMQSFAEFSIIIPGSGIPMWSLHERIGFSATIELPKDWYSGTFKGLAFWAVFKVSEPPLFSIELLKPHNYRLDFELKCNDQSLIAENGIIISGDTHAVSDHVWLRYFSLSTFKMTVFEEEYSQIQVFVTTKERGLVVKKCGLYPLCSDNINHTLIDVNSHFDKSAASILKSSQCLYPSRVFLNFEIENLQLFEQLDWALSQKSITTSCGGHLLQRGRCISPWTKKMIQSSRIAIVVFSNNYVKSSRCLEELVEIIDCMDAGLLRVLPICHGVDISDVRNLTGTFTLDKESFQEGERERIPIWRYFLTRAANLAGLDTCNRDETFTEEVAMHLFTELSHEYSNVTPALVGMDSRIDELLSLLETGRSDVGMIGICGIGGIGKTTIAEKIYHLISRRFDGSFFLERAREAMKNPDGCSSLQRQLLSAVLGLKPWEMVEPIESAMLSKRVLIVLDDVEDMEHLEALAGSRNWFGPGSRIIITSRHRLLLEVHGVDIVYEVELLNDLDSHTLFKEYAFKGSSEIDELATLSQEVVSYAKGLPFAVKVLGSSLKNMTVREWENALDKLIMYPPIEVQSVLQLSFNGLDPTERKMFLDIACFFNGDHADKVINFLKSCGHFSVAALRSLEDKCLVTTIDNKILMHHSLQEMGRKFVHEESEYPGERSRLWDHEDVNSVLAENEGTDEVEGMVLDLAKTNKENFKFEAFSRMSNLRLLKIYWAHLPTVSEYFSPNNST